MERRPEQIADEWLVLRAQEGSAASLDILLKRWHRPLWLRAVRLIGNEEAAKDVVQESLIAISRGIRKLNDPARFRAWAFRIVTHKSNDWIRKRGRERKRDEAAFEEAKSETISNHSGSENEAVSRIREVMDLLPPQQREILRLFYQQGFTLSEISETEGIPVGTAKSRLFHARKLLKNKLTKP